MVVPGLPIAAMPFAVRVGWGSAVSQCVQFAPCCLFLNDGLTAGLISHRLCNVTAGIIEQHPLMGHIGIEFEEVVQAAPKSAFHDFSWHIVATQSHPVFDTPNSQAAAAQGKVINCNKVTLRFEPQ